MADDWRAEKWKIASQGGSAPSKAAPKAVHWRGQGQEATSTTSVRAGMVPIGPTTQGQKPSTTSSAANIIPDGLKNTVWIESPQSIAAQPSLLLEAPLPLEPLGTKDSDRLTMLAESTGCSVEEYVLEIVRFYVEEDADILECGSLFDVVQFYLTNEIIG